MLQYNNRVKQRPIDRRLSKPRFEQVNKSCHDAFGKNVITKI